MGSKPRSAGIPLRKAGGTAELLVIDGRIVAFTPAGPAGHEISPEGAARVEAATNELMSVMRKYGY